MKKLAWETRRIGAGIGLCVAVAACEDGSGPLADPNVEAPGPPVVVASPASSSSIQLAITPGARADSHSVHVSTTSGFSPTVGNAVALLGASPTAYTLAGLNAGTTYHGRVLALNAGGIGESAQWSATTSAGGSPPPLPSGVWYAQNWDFATSTALRSGVNAVVQLGGGTVNLQTSGVEGGLSTVNKAFRAVYATSGESTAGVSLLPPNWNVTRPREVWVEVMVRFNAAWNIQSDDKTFFYMEDRSAAGGEAETARWETHIVSPTRQYGGPSGALGAGIPDFFIRESTSINPWNGQWRRLRHHLRMSSTPSATDGAYRVWLDDIQLFNRTGFATGSPAQAYFRNIWLGMNADPSGSGIRDWGRVLVYVSNPGW